MGADIVINPESEDAVARVYEITDGRGADAAIEAVGVPETFELCARLIRPRGRLANVGVHGRPATLHLEELWAKDVTVAIAMVTLFGTLALVLLPLLQGVLGLTDAQYGIWAGASVHEVGQVVAAASPAGAAVVAIAVVVKLARVVMLAPVVAAVSLVQRFTQPASTAGAARTPLVPLFVLGFLACVALRSTGLVPVAVLGGIGNVQVAALGAALFGMGCSVKIASLLRRSGAVIVVSTLGTLCIAGVSLAGILLVTGR